MAATNYTPISLYYSTTPSAVPLNTSLVAGELALNTIDEKLYFKNSAGTVKLLASNAASGGTVSSVAQSFTGGLISVAGSPITTSGTLALTVAGTSGGVPYFSSASTWATSAALTQYGVVYGGGAGAAPVSTAAGTTGQVLTANTGAAPTWGTVASMTYPGAGIANSTGSAWGTSYTTTGSGSVVALATSPTFVTPNLGTPASGTVTNLTGTASININGTVGATTATTATFTSVQITSLGVGTAASGTTGEIRATNNITAYYSDDRLKKRLGSVENALDKVRTLDSFYYEANETAQELGYEPIREVGISAQQVQAVLPEVVVPAPIDDRYLTVRYERLVPLLIAAIKELEAKVKVLEAK